MGSERLSMAELQPVTDTTQTSICIPVSRAASRGAVPSGAGPLWRSLFFPRRGQRAVEFGSDGSTLFASLRRAGVRIEHKMSWDEPAGESGFDLVLEDRTDGRQPVRLDNIRSLLGLGGRWVVVVEKRRWVGMAGDQVLRRARREGFETI